MKILKDMQAQLSVALPMFQEVQKHSDAVMNQVIDQEVEAKMSPEEKEILKGARKAYNLKGTSLGKKMDELNKLMKQCQHL